MYVSVGPGGAPPSSFAIGALTAERAATGEPLVVAKVRNTGPQTLAISGSLTLSNGPGGLRTGPFAVALRAALEPGGTELARVRLDRRLPRGPWRAEIRLTSGAITHDAAATITFPPSVVVTKPPGPSPLPRGGLILLGLLVLALLGFLFTRRFLRYQHAAEGPL